MKSLVVLSGGMDSATALAWARGTHKEVSAVHFQYGSKHNLRELQAAEKLAVHYNIGLHVVHLPFSQFKSDLLLSGGDIPEGHYADESMKRTVVPFRNGILLAFAAGLAESIGAGSVVLGNHAGDHAIYPDCRPEFAAKMAEAIRLGTYAQIELLCPFQNINKTEIAKIGKALAVPYQLTWTCYKGKEKHCGKCGSCVERQEAFRDSNQMDPTVYET